jgi:hypothetical protein
MGKHNQQQTAGQIGEKTSNIIFFAGVTHHLFRYVQTRTVVFPFFSRPE